jgi:hypothetical protein
MLRLAGWSGLLAFFCGCAHQSPPHSSSLHPPHGAPIAFQNVQPQSGIDFKLGHDLRQPLGIRATNGHPVALLDADGDGLLDVLLAGPDRVELFRNMRGWRFEPVPEAGFRQNGYWQGVAVGDVDNDGRPDLYLSGFGCAARYLNQGGGRFRDAGRASEERAEHRRKALVDGGPGRGANSGLVDHLSGQWLTSAAFSDWDRDGRLDLYVGAYVALGDQRGVCEPAPGVKTACGPLSFPAQRGHLYRNMGGGRFQDVTLARGLAGAHGRTLGVAFADVNDDGWPDLYLANDKMAGDLFLNESGRRFVSRGTEAGVAYGPDGYAQGGMGVDFGDYDGDGRPDLVVTTFQREPTSLYHDDGNARFTNVAYRSGIGPPTMNQVGYGVKWVDLDNDGRLDLAMANGHPLHRIHEIDPSTAYRQPFQLFHNEGGGIFTELTSLGDGLPSPIVGRALCAGDLDNDGKIDLLISDIEGQPLLLRNVSPTHHHWLSVDLKSRKPFEGTRITARKGSRQWVRWCSRGGSYLSASDARVHFGLGDVDALDELEVRWPWGQTTRVKGVRADQQIEVRPQGLASQRRG